MEGARNTARCFVNNEETSNQLSWLLQMFEFLGSEYSSGVFQVHIFLKDLRIFLLLDRGIMI